MSWRVAADALLVAHLAFIVFVVGGGWLALAWARWRVALITLHLPALAWAVWIELSGGVCPLTPLENAWRQRAGEAGYRGDFVEHYLLAAIYPQGLTRQTQAMLAAALLVINVLAYAALLRARQVSRKP